LTNGSAIAKRWDSARSAEIARVVSSVPNLYCGPAAIGWIAAVWNESKGRPYDVIRRLKDKKLFPDGPRPFHGSVFLMESNLNDLLKRETNGELGISRETYFRSESIHSVLQQFEMPVIIRMVGRLPKDGLHYVTLYKSEIKEQTKGFNQVEFHWQDNGLYGIRGGLSATTFRSQSHIILWGAKRVILT
jgi:hypothetical protein